MTVLSVMYSQPHARYLDLFCLISNANVRLIIEDSMCSSLQMDDSARNLSLRDDGRHHKSSGFLDHRDGERAMHWTCHMVWRTGCPGVCALRLSV